jgi:hypothetical protein
MMRPLLVVLNPRRIRSCLAAIDALDIPKVYLIGYTEADLQTAFPDAVKEAWARRYDPLVVISDDTQPTQQALDAVLRFAPTWPVVTGYCNLAADDPRVNLTDRPFTNLRPGADDYPLIQRPTEPLTRSWFAGWCLTVVPTELFMLCGFGTIDGCKSDLVFSLRMQRSYVPIVAPRDGFVYHVKERWNQPDQAPEKRILVGETAAEVRWDA